MAPPHSTQLIRWWNQKAKIATRNGNSSVAIGWTMVSRPKCSAEAWKRNPEIRNKQPRSQTFRRMA